LGVAREELDALTDRLRQQQAIERVFMQEG